jgi:hypothetical protein
MKFRLITRRTALLSAAAFAACTPAPETKSKPEAGKKQAASNWDRTWALVEQSNRYMGIDNDEGFLAIARMALCQALMLRFRRTGDTRWLDFAAEQFDEALIMRASDQQQSDYRGKSLPTWLYKAATGANVYIAYHAGNIARHLIDFAELVRATHPQRAERFAHAALAAMQACEIDYDPGVGAYRWPTDFPTDEPFAHGRVVSSNGNILAAFAWRRLGQYFNKPEYTERFARYLKFFRAGGIDPRYPDQPVPGIELRKGEHGPYFFWLYDPYVPPDHRVAEDILHISWSVEPILHDIAGPNFAFNASDLPAIAGTLRQFIVDANTSPPQMMFRIDDRTTLGRTDAVAFYRAFIRLPRLPGLASAVDKDTLKVADALLAEMLSDPALAGTADARRVNYFNSPAFLLNYVAWSDADGYI